MNAEELARLFHDTYEKVAPLYKYITNVDTREFDPKSPNGKTMLAMNGAPVDLPPYLYDRIRDGRCNIISMGTQRVRPRMRQMEVKYDGK